RDAPLQVELVAGRALGVEVGGGDAGPVGAGAAGGEGHGGVVEPGPDRVPVGVGPEPGGQARVAPEPPEGEGDVREAATGVLVDAAVGAVHHVDQRLADDEHVLAVRTGAVGRRGGGGG